MKEAIERIVGLPKFQMKALHQVLWPLVEANPLLAVYLPAIHTRLGNALYAKLGYALLRHVFLIEPVLSRGGATKVRARWTDALANDPRYCSFDECFQIAGDLLYDLANGWLDTPEHLEALTLFHQQNVLAYEAPLDYRDPVLPNSATARIHRRGNLVWTCNATILRTLRLRRYLTDPARSPDAPFFKKVLMDKVVVKTYLTDRAQTGEHQTNREKRWEAHPRSVQFATRRATMAIEYRLITQLCAFKGFPESARQSLQKQGILPELVEEFRCPITLEPMSYEAFREALMNPLHGKSDFQVGHLNPLKSTTSTAEVFGHTAENISWISADGNRIQGSATLADIRALLVRIARNYERKGLIAVETPTIE